MTKTKSQLETEIILSKYCTIEHAEKSFAAKLVERIVYSFVAIILVSVIGALLTLVLTQ